MVNWPLRRFSRETVQQDVDCLVAFVCFGSHLFVCFTCDSLSPVSLPLQFTHSRHNISYIQSSTVLPESSHVNVMLSSSKQTCSTLHVLLRLIYNYLPAPTSIIWYIILHTCLISLANIRIIKSILQHHILQLHTTLRCRVGCEMWPVRHHHIWSIWLLHYYIKYVLY